MPFHEEIGNLFDPKYGSYALGHCVGNDFLMGAGIAIEFRQRYGMVEWLRYYSKGVGTTLRLIHYDRPIFYLITKPSSQYSKPTYETLGASLRDLFAQMQELKIKKIAVPRLGCGLDGLDWRRVRELIQDLCPPEVTVTAVLLE